MITLPDNIKNCINIYKTLTKKDRIIYLSTPITTGKRFVEWYDNFGKEPYSTKEYHLSHYMNVVKKNKNEAKDYAESIYERTNNVVVNPAEFEAEFSQAEYMLLWTEFIKEFTSKIVFAPDWAYSNGCLGEFITALSNKVPRLDFLFNEINNTYAIDALFKAKKRLIQSSLKTDLQDNLLKLLKNE